MSSRPTWYTECIQVQAGIHSVTRSKQRKQKRAARCVSMYVVVDAYLHGSSHLWPRKLGCKGRRITNSRSALAQVRHWAPIRADLHREILSQKPKMCLFILLNLIKGYNHKTYFSGHRTYHSGLLLKHMSRERREKQTKAIFLNIFKKQTNKKKANSWGSGVDGQLRVLTQNPEFHHQHTVIPALHTEALQGQPSVSLDNRDSISE